MVGPPDSMEAECGKGQIVSCSLIRRANQLGLGEGRLLGKGWSCHEGVGGRVFVSKSRVCRCHSATSWFGVEGGSESSCLHTDLPNAYSAKHWDTQSSQRWVPGLSSMW